MYYQSDIDNIIKQAVVIRAKEFGMTLDLQQLTIEYYQGDVAPDCRVFRAWFGESAISGLIENGNPPNTYPQLAFGKLFDIWRHSTAGLPSPERVTMIFSFLYDATARKRVVTSESEKKSLLSNPEWISRVQLPRSIEVDGRPGISFWWVGNYGPSEMRVYLDSSNRIETEEMFITR